MANLKVGIRLATFLLILTCYAQSLTAQTKTQTKQTKGEGEAKTQVSYPPISNKQIFLYYLKVYKVNLNEIVRNPFRDDAKDTWIEGYLKLFDAANYQQAKNDEFKINGLRISAKEKINNEINSCSFDQYFSQINNYSEIGTYDFNTNSFPVTVKHIGTSMTLSFMTGRVDMTMEKFSNLNSFDLNLKMPQDEASKLIDSRKNASGVVNRFVSLKTTYKILDTQLPPGDEKQLIGEIISIEVWGDSNGKFQRIGALQRKAP